MGRALRRAAGAIVVCSLLVAAAAYYRYSPELALTAGGGAADSAEPAPDEPSTSAATPTVTPTVAAPEPPTSGRPARIRLIVRVEKRGVFEVTETVRLSAPVTRLDLAPPDVRLAGGTLRTARAVVTDVDLRAGGRPVRLPDRTVRGPRTVRLKAATDRFELRYRLNQTIRRNTMSPTPGRAIGAVAPVVVGVPDEVPVAVAFRSAAVLNVICPCLPAAEQTCFAGHRPAVRVGTDLARKDALVVVQLDLRKA
jgi:hypothetical protein